MTPGERPLVPEPPPTSDHDPTPADANALDVRALTLRLGARVLLEHAAFSVRRGERVLLVGASGAGKSLLLQVLQGIAPRDLRISGDLRVFGREVFGFGGKRLIRRRLGRVFQEGGLLDEWSIDDNLRFAHDHSPRRRRGAQRRDFLDALRQALGVDRRLALTTASGGERRRVAVACAAAYDPDLLLYDEPTAGLDPVNARRTVDLICDTHDRLGKTTVIVTHDYEHFSGRVDRVLLLDAAQRGIVELSPHDDLAAAVQNVLGQAPDAAGVAPQGLGVRARACVASVFDATTMVFALALRWVLALIPAWPRPLWGLRFFAHYLRLVAGWSSLAYLALAGLVLGFVTTYFTFRFFPYPEFTRPLLEDEGLRAIGVVSFRALVPLIASLLIAARCGAAVTADLGNRRLSRQIDAMAGFGAEPCRYLGTGLLWAFLLGTPLLVAAATVTSEWASLQGFLIAQDQRMGAFWDRHYHYLLREDARPWWRYVGVEWLLGKTLASAFLVAFGCWLFGASEQRSPVAVGRSITRAILFGTLATLLVHLGFAFFEFEDMPGVSR